MNGLILQMKLCNVVSMLLPRLAAAYMCMVDLEKVIIFDPFAYTLALVVLLISFSLPFYFCVGVLLEDLLISGELLSSGPPIPSILWRSFI